MYFLHMIFMPGWVSASHKTVARGPWSYEYLMRQEFSIRRVRFPVNADGAPTFSDGWYSFFMNDGGATQVGDWLELIAMLMET